MWYLTSIYLQLKPNVGTLYWDVTCYIMTNTLGIKFVSEHISQSILHFDLSI